MFKIINRNLYLIIFTGIILRLFLIVNFIPDIQSELFLPFINHTINNLNFDIWESWLEKGGRTDSFPYGIGMILLTIFPSYLISFLLELTLYEIHIIIGITFLTIDLIIVYVIHKLTNSNLRLLAYLFSPVLLYISFYHGQFDIIPTFYFLLVIYFIKKNKLMLSGIFLALAISAKLSFLLVLPFFLVFYINNPRYRDMFNNLFKYFITSLTFLELPLLFFTGYESMVLSTPESKRILTNSLEISPDFKVLIFPIVYLSMIYWLWRTGRTTLDVLISFSTATLIAISLSSGGAIGWFLWAIPLISIITYSREKIYILIFLIFQLLIIFIYGPINIGSISRLHFLNFNLENVNSSELINNISFTFFITLGCFVILSTLKSAIFSGDVFSFTKKPISVAIAGNSGTGKDTLTRNLLSVFGEKNTTVILGDDYHNYERHSHKWHSVTHLNPDANDLKSFTINILKAINRETVISRYYNHEFGKFSLPRTLKPADFVIVNGLHALSLGSLQKQVDLNIFLEMNEQLVKKFKIARDTLQRKKSKDAVVKQINERREDYIKFIKIQKNKADLNFYVYDTNLGRSGRNNELNLQVMYNGLYSYNDVIMFLQNFTNLTYTNKTIDNLKIIDIKKIRIESYIFNQFLKSKIEFYDQFFSIEPKFNDNIQGLMTFMVVLALIEKRTKIKYEK